MAADFRKPIEMLQLLLLLLALAAGKILTPILKAIKKLLQTQDWDKWAWESRRQPQQAEGL
jgi:hypothetical protein